MNIKHTIAVLVCLFAIQHASAQDFKVSKTDDNKVEITYNTKRNLKKVELFVSTNSGQDYQGPLNITGDTYDIPRGKGKRIFWDPATDTPEGDKGLYRFRLDRYREVNTDVYSNRFFIMLNPSFLNGEYACAGFGGTIGYIFRKFGLTVSIGSYFGGLEPAFQSWSSYESGFPSWHSSYHDGYNPNLYFQVGGLYKVTDMIAIKAGLGFLRDENMHKDYTGDGYDSFNLLGSLGLMLQFNHFLVSLDGNLTSTQGELGGFCGGLTLGIGYAF